MKIFLGLIFGLDGEVVRKTFIERKCATVAPSDRIDCGYEGKNKAFSENFQYLFYESIKMPAIPSNEPHLKIYKSIFRLIGTDELKN